MKSTYELRSTVWKYGHVKTSYKEQMNYLFMPKGKWWKFEGGLCKVTPSKTRDEYIVTQLKFYAGVGIPFGVHTLNLAQARNYEE